MAERTEVVVTGIGAVGPFGYGADALWEGLMAGRAALRPFDLFDASEHRTAIAGQVPNERKNARRLSRADGFALAAAGEAWRHAGLEADECALHAGVFFGSSAAGMLEGESFFRELIEGSPVLRSSPLAAQQTNCPGDAVARALGLCGPVEIIASACSAATMAIESALVSLRSGETDIAIAGGADGLCQLTYAGFNALRAVDAQPCRPFRAERAGLSIGEGAGALVLETRARAEARGAPVLAELCGAASTCDAHHMTAPEPEGDGAARAILGALRDAGLDSSAVDFVNAHGTGTPHNDAAEWKALERVFGSGAGRLPVNTTKAAVGHSLGACGAIEAVACVLALQARRLPPAPAGGSTDSACPVDLVIGEARSPRRCDVAVSTNLAFGGANAALVLRRAPATTPA